MSEAIESSCHARAEVRRWEHAILTDTVMIVQRRGRGWTHDVSAWYTFCGLVTFWGVLYETSDFTIGVVHCGRSCRDGNGISGDLLQVRVRVSLEIHMSIWGMCFECETTRHSKVVPAIACPFILNLEESFRNTGENVVAQVLVLRIDQ